MDEQTHFRTCPLCEATCGLAITTRGREVTSVRGDDDDVFSHGYICPKGPAVAALDSDPDRLRNPMIRKGSTWSEVSWDDAFAEIDRQLPRIIRDHGRDAVAVYLGNPSAHNLALMLYPRALLRVLGSRNVYSASTVDQMPKQVSAGLMFGTALSVPVPDIDRTQYLLMLGADPLVSNGSLMTAPDVRGRLRAIKARGGRIVVVDPRRSRTAGEATEHLFIRPGTDAHFLMGVAHVIVAENLTKLGRLAEHVNGLDDVKALVRDWTPDNAARACGISAETIRTIARDLATTERAAVYGRIGTCTQEFGTLASWLVDVLNTLTGHLDQEGGAMFTKAAVGAVNTRGIPGRGKGVRFGRRTSRVSGTPEVFGELPVACLAEEMETPGDGQIRALITIAGNPALSNPNGGRLTKALASLEFMVSCDIYLNETSRHAHVILPGLSPLEVPHYDIGLLQLAIRNVANYSPPLFAPPADRPAEWQTMLKLGAIVMGQGAGADPDAVDDFVARQQVDETIGANGSPIAGRDGDEIMAALAPRRGPERLLDLMLRVGPYGDAFGARPDGLTLATLLRGPRAL